MDTFCYFKHAVVVFFIGLATASAHPETAVPPAWATPCGGEFWQAAEPRQDIDLPGIADRIAHAVRPQVNGAFAVKARLYRAEFPDGRILFMPHAREEAPALLQARVLGGAPSPSAWWFTGNTAQRLIKPELSLVEHVEARADGLHLAWIFGKAPPPKTDWSLELAVGGYAPAGASAQGHVYASAVNPEARLCIGPAVVVDATGQRWALETRQEKGLLVITVPADILAEAQVPFCIDPAVSPQFGVDGATHALAPANDRQLEPKVAWGLTNGLVVWQDLRKGDFGEAPEVYATRIAPGGAILDPVGLRIAPERDSQESPSVAWNGSSFLVAWKDVDAQTNWSIYSACVRPDGSQQAAVQINSHTNASRWGPAVASDGTGLSLVAWTDYRTNSYNIFGRLVDNAGQPVGGTDIPICIVSNHQQRVAVAWGGTNFLAAWEDHRNKGVWNEANIYAARISPEGQVLETNGLRLYPASGQYGSQSDPSAAWGTGDYLVVWSDARNYTSSNKWDIYGARIDSAGSNLFPASFRICTATNNQSQPHAVWGGTNHWITWVDYRGTSVYAHIYGTRMDASTNVLDAQGFAISTNSTRGCWNPCGAWNGSTLFAAWEDDRRGYDETDIYGARIQHAQVLNPAGLLLSASADNQWVPSAAWGLTNYLVVWRDNLDETTSDIYGARVGPLGGVLDPAGIAICTASNKQRDPKVAWGGTNWLVVWEDDRNTNKIVMGTLAYQDVFGARVSAGGQVLEPSGIGICTNPGPQFEPVCAWNGADSFLVAWRDYRVATAPYPSDIYGTRVNPAGQVLDGMLGIAICTATNFQFRPQISWGASNYLVAWEDGRNATNRNDIYGARVSGSGVLLDPDGIAISTYPTNKGVPHVAWGSTNWLVLWQDRRNNWNENDLFGARITPGGSVLDAGAGLAICTATGHQFNQTIAWSGTNWLAAWNDWRFDYRYRVYGARITPAGAVLEGADTGFALFNDDASRMNAALAAGSNGLILLAFTSLRHEGLNAQRIMGSFVDLAPPTIEIISPYGLGNPPAGAHSAVRWLPVTCQITNTPDTRGSTQYVCRGWVGSGSAPASGTTNTCGPFLVTNNTTIAWLWTTNYHLSVATGGAGSVSGPQGWLAFGSNITLSASQGPHFYFNGWQGDIPPASTNANPLGLTMSQPRSVAVLFAPYLATNKTPHWWLAQYGLPTNDAAALADADHDGQLTWEEGVAMTDPTNPASAFAPLMIAEPNSILSLQVADTRTDRLYDVLWKPGAVNETNAWTPCAASRPGTGGGLSFVVTNNEALGLYRFRVWRTGP